MAVSRPPYRFPIEFINTKVYKWHLNSTQFNQWLAKQGCAFESKKSGSGHVIVRLGDRKSELPMHGGSKELGTGLVNKIKKDLGLK
jgi:mRNA interferase HicA